MIVWLKNRISISDKAFLDFTVGQRSFEQPKQLFVIDSVYVILTFLWVTGPRGKEARGLLIRDELHEE